MIKLTIREGRSIIIAKDSQWDTLVRMADLWLRNNPNSTIEMEDTTHESKGSLGTKVQLLQTKE